MNFLFKTFSLLHFLNIMSVNLSFKMCIDSNLLLLLLFFLPYSIFYSHLIYMTEEDTAAAGKIMHK